MGTGSRLKNRKPLLSKCWGSLPGSMDWLGSGLMEQLKNYKELFPFIEDLRRNELIINYVQKKFPKGETIFHEGDRCAGVPFVMRGCIRVSKIGKNGKEISVYRVNPGETYVSLLSCKKQCVKKSDGKPYDFPPNFLFRGHIGQPLHIHNAS